MQYLGKAILHSPRFNRFPPARYHIHLAVILKLHEQRKQTIGNACGAERAQSESEIYKSQNAGLQKWIRILK